MGMNAREQMIGEVLTSHVAPAAAVGGLVAAGIFGVVDDLSSVPTMGVGAAGAFLLALVGILFRSQQQQIASLREQNRDQQRRIDKLEHELDMQRDLQRSESRASVRRADGMQTEISDIGGHQT